MAALTKPVSRLVVGQQLVDDFIPMMGPTSSSTVHWRPTQTSRAGCRLLRRRWRDCDTRSVGWCWRNRSPRTHEPHNICRQRRLHPSPLGDTVAATVARGATVERRVVKGWGGVGRFGWVKKGHFRLVAFCWRRSHARHQNVKSCESDLFTAA